MTFMAGGRWHGSDGCNGLGGTYRLNDAGEFSASPVGARTAIGCANVPNDTVLGTAVRVTTANDVLVFEEETGLEIGRYARV